MSWCVGLTGFVSGNVGNEVMACRGDRFCL